MRAKLSNRAERVYRTGEGTFRGGRCFAPESAEREARAILAETEPKGRECYRVPLGLMAMFDSGTALAEAITAWCERLDGYGWQE